MVTRSRLWGNTVHHRSSVRLQGSPHRTVVPAGHSSNLLLPPSLIQPLPGGGIEVILPWITSPDPAETDVSSAGCSTSSASASAMHHGQQGAPLSQMQGTDVAQSWAHQTAVRFPAMGSGLLWARSTGLKVWPGALVLSRIMALHMAEVADAVVEARRDRGQDPGSTTGSGSTDSESSSVSSSDLRPQRQDLRQIECQESSYPATKGDPSGPTSWNSWEDVVVVELGCGLALCSIIAAKLGARVLGTDGDPDLVRIAKNNIAENTRGSRNSPAVSTLSWGDPGSLSRSLEKLSASARNQVPGRADTPRARPDAQTLQQPVGPLTPPIDIVLLSDVVYGSNPGTWERLADSLVGLCVAGRCTSAGPSSSEQGGETRGAQGILHDMPPESGPSATLVALDLDPDLREGTLILQCETTRLEGVLYDEYWEILGRSGFRWTSLHDRVDCNVEGSEVRAWAIWKD